MTQVPTEPSTLHPSDIVRELDSFFTQADLTDEHKKVLKQAVRLTLPHLSQQNVQTCVQAVNLVADKSSLRPKKAMLAEAIVSLVSTEAFTSLPSKARFKTSHPLATAIEALFSSAKENPETDLAQFIDFLIDISDYQNVVSDEFNTPTYYHHVLAIRDVLVFIHQHYEKLATHQKCSLIDTVISIHELHKTDPNALLLMGLEINAIANFDQKIQTVSALIHQQAVLGHRQRQQHTASIRSKPSEKVTRPSGASDHPFSTNTGIFSAEFVQKIRQTDQHRRNSLESTLNKRNLLDQEASTNEDDFTQVMFTPTRCQKANTPISDETQVDADSANLITVAIPDFITHSQERREFVVRSAHHYAARNVISSTDIHRLSYWQVLERLVLIQRFGTPLLFIYLFLLFSTGINPVRLSQLRISKSNPKDDQIVLNPETSWLTYRVNHCGAVTQTKLLDDHPEDELPSNHVIILSIPVSFNSEIIDADCEQPFLDMMAGFKQAKAVIRKKTGKKMGTLNQFKASSCAFLQGALSRLEATYLSGSIPFEEGASSAYRAICLDRVNRQYQYATARAHEGLVEEWGHQELLASEFPTYLQMMFSDSQPTGMIGSIRYQNIETLIPLTKDIKNQVKQLKTELSAANRTKTVSKLVKLLNLQHIMYWLALHLHSLGRPLGETTQLSYSDGFLWCSDKCNHAYRERKLIPILNADQSRQSILLQQVEAIQASHAQLTALMKRLNLSLPKDFEVDKQALPLPRFFKICYQKPTAKQKSKMTLHHPWDKPGIIGIDIQLMKRSLFSECLQSLALDHTFESPLNLFRHIASSELSNTLSDAGVDECLGHKHPGRDYWGLESSGLARDLQLLIEHINDWISRAGVRVVDLPKHLFEGFYERY